jgi:uncharacterized protein YjbI with pentapeptide repeats
MKKILFTVLLTLSFNATAGSYAGAKLAGANFNGVTFPVGTSFKGADLTGATIIGTCIKCNFTGAKMEKIIMAGSNLDGSYFPGANLTDADLYNVKCRKCVAIKAKMKGAILTWGNWNGGRFDGADMRNIVAQNASFQFTNFNGAVLPGADFCRANVINANLETADLTGARFEEAKVYWPLMANSVWDGVSVKMARLIGMKWGQVKSMKNMNTENAYLGKK